MFSGIIEHQARILHIENGLFRVENVFSDRDDSRDEPLHTGQSIAHDGACMTLTRVTEDSYEFFMMQESLRVTNLGTKKVWDTLNVERSMRLWDRIDGHMVSGHVDTVGSVKRLEKQSDGSLIYGVVFDPEYDPLIIQKGSIAINGTSLTLVEVWSGYFTVSLIPLTQDWTNLWRSHIGESVNLEFDMIGKYISKLKDNT